LCCANGSDPRRGGASADKESVKGPLVSVIQTVTAARRQRAEEETGNHRDLEDLKGASALAFHSSGRVFFEVFGSSWFVSLASV